MAAGTEQRSVLYVESLGLLKLLRVREGEREGERERREGEREMMLTRERRERGKEVP